MHGALPGAAWRAALPCHLHAAGHLVCSGNRLTVRCVAGSPALAGVKTDPSLCRLVALAGPRVSPIGTSSDHRIHGLRSRGRSAHSPICLGMGVYPCRRRNRLAVEATSSRVNIVDQSGVLRVLVGDSRSNVATRAPRRHRIPSEQSDDHPGGQPIHDPSRRHPTSHFRTKHFAVHASYSRERIEDGDIVLQWLPTDKMPADMLTKALAGVKHQRFCGMVGLADVHLEGVC